MYVELKDINKTFGDYKASDHVSFGIEKGKLIGLLGPSGSGKTTILRMIAGLEQPDSGEIIIDGKVVNDIPASERGIGFVFQSYALFRYMTVYDNIAFGLKVKKADVSSLNEVCEVCKGADAVISAFNPGWNNPNIYDETIKVYLTIIDGVKKAGVNRFLMVGGAGSLFIAPGLRLMDSGEVPENILPGVKALGEFYLNFLMKEKEIDWVFFSPAADMRPGVRTGRYRLGKDDMIVDIVGNSHISVEDYAAAMIDELEHPKHHQERFTIGY